MEYNDINSRYSKEEIEKFDANLGGTNIYEPLQSVFTRDTKNAYKKRIFLLTDG